MKRSTRARGREEDGVVDREAVDAVRQPGPPLVRDQRLAELAIDGVCRGERVGDRRATTAGASTTADATATARAAGAGDGAGTTSP